MPSTPIQQEKRPIPADPFTWDPPPLGQGPGIRLEDVVWANQVRKKLERYFQYPPAARQDLTDTRVVIELHISPKGRLLDYRWIKRSRHRIFNQTAYLACLQAAPFPMPPQGIQERFLKIRIPFNYTLYR